MKKPPLGSGERFNALRQTLMLDGKNAESATKIAAYIGRKKYGNKKMTKLAAKGRKK